LWTADPAFNVENIKNILAFLILRSDARGILCFCEHRDEDGPTFFFRDFRNRREVGGCFGLGGSPWCSGETEREQWISKAAIAVPATPPSN
jgi:hypothetical protein